MKIHLIIKQFFLIILFFSYKYPSIEAIRKTKHVLNKSKLLDKNNEISLIQIENDRDIISSVIEELKLDETKSKRNMKKIFEITSTKVTIIPTQATTTSTSSTTTASSTTTKLATTKPTPQTTTTTIRTSKRKKVYHTHKKLRRTKTSKRIETTTRTTTTEGFFDRLKKVFLDN